MTITPTAEQEEILAAAIQAGLIGSAEEGLNVGVELLRSRLAIRHRAETAEEWIERFHAWIDSHAGQTVVLSDEAMSREFIYRERGL
jgi:hypothetical protein